MTGRTRSRFGFAALLLTGCVLALSTAPCALADPRIRTVAYGPDRVISLNAYPDYQMMIVLDGVERIESVAVGKANDWEVAPSKEGDRIFLKPVDGAARTNMTVVTNARTYLFELLPHEASELHPGAVTYLVRFSYPVVATRSASRALTPPEPPPEPAPARRNVEYTFAGSRTLLPSEVFDDGRFTYFRWPEDAPIPAVFAVGSDGGESLVNQTLLDGLEVVQQLAPEFRLRDGGEVTTVVNEAFHLPDPGPNAPKAHVGPLPIPERRGDL